MDVDFDRELRRGVAAYDDALARWWLGRAADAAHRRAYRRIARFAAASFPAGPRRIVDLGCGAGHLLAELRRVFPRAELVGYDASTPLLRRARRRLERSTGGGRVRLVQTVLPDPALAGTGADLLVLAFPNFLPRSPRTAVRAHGRALGAAGCRAARRFARGSGVPYAALVFDRLLSLQARRLLRRGGTCLRVDYCGGPRDELLRQDRRRVAFEEGSRVEDDGGRDAPPVFRLLASRYVRSRVIRDVYEQTRDRADLTGGYAITVLRAV